MKRYWSINGRFLAQPITGVQRYAMQVVQAIDELLVANDPRCEGLEIDLVVPPGVAQTLKCRGIRARTISGLNGHLWEQLTLPRHLKGGLLSLCNTGPILHSRQIVCVHDVNTRIVPQSYSKKFRAVYRILQPALCRRAEMVTTVSEYSAEQLVCHRIVEPDKLTLAPNGHEHAADWVPRHSSATRNAAGRETIVVVGSLAPHKNVGLILDQAERLSEIGLKIAIVGLKDRRVFASVGKNYSAKNIFWLGNVSDSALAALLRDSLCLCFPSFTEGFGLPVLEAMAVGCPVITTNSASLPEVCGDAALYASPLDADVWWNKICDLRSDPQLAKQLIERGRIRAQRFSWRSTAGSYLDLMARMDEVTLG